MVCFKEFQRGDRPYLSIVDAGDAPTESGSSFLIHCSLRKPKAAQVLTIEPSSFA